MGMGRRLAACLGLVDEGAVLPDLALGAGLDVDGAHPDHGAREDLEEDLGRRVHDAEDVGLGRGVGDERGVGLEQAAALEHAAVVAEVEGEEAARVHLHDRRVVRRRLALGPPQVRSVRRVQRRVRVAGTAAPREVVQPLGEGVAVGDADRVSPCMHTQRKWSCRGSSAAAIQHSALEQRCKVVGSSVHVYIRRGCRLMSCTYEKWTPISGPIIVWSVTRNVLLK